MNRQTYIIALEDSQGRTVNFERFCCRRMETCMHKMITLYRKLIHYSFAIAELDRTARVVCYPTPDGYNSVDPVRSVDIDTFRALLYAEARQS